MKNSRRLASHATSEAVRITRIGRLRALAVLGAGLLVLTVTACEDSDERATATEGDFVGTVDGTDAYIGLLSDGEQVAGYVCSDGEVSRWFDVTDLDNGSARLLGRDGENLGEVRFDDDAATGDVKIDSASHAFEIVPARGDAGVYRATLGDPGDAGSVEVGWVVLADGSRRGAKTSFIDSESDLLVEPAPPMFMKTGADFVVDLGASTGTTRVEKLDTQFTETGTDI